MTALPEVLEKLERATPGPWHYSERGFSTKPTPMVYATGQDLNYIAMCRDFGNEGPTLNEENAQAIVAAVNFLREHGPALLRDAGDGERLRDLHDSIRRVYDITPMLPITVETMDGATDALTAFCMLVGIHKVDIGPYKPKDAAMHAPGGAGGGDHG